MSWKQYQRFEQRGDLQKQADLLTKALQGKVAPQIIQEALLLARQSAAQAELKNPSPIFTLKGPSFCVVNPQNAEPLQELPLPAESGRKKDPMINWSNFSGKQVMGLVAKGSHWLPQDILSVRDFRVPGLRLNAAYPYLPTSPAQTLSAHTRYLCKRFISPRMALENLVSKPFDLMISSQHPYFIVTDRGAGKLHFIQRKPLKAMRSWRLTAAPHKKVLQAEFHPDGRRVYACSYQQGAFHIVDRAMAQKRLTLNTSGLVSNGVLSNRGDLFYVYIVKGENVEILVVDTQKHQIQHTFTLEGTALSSQTDTQDVMALTPDGRYLMTLVSRNRPSLFSAYLLQIDVSTGSVVNETLLKPEDKPLQLAFPARELTTPRIRLLPLLLHGGHGLTEADVQDALA